MRAQTTPLHNTTWHLFGTHVVCLPVCRGTRHERVRPPRRRYRSVAHPARLTTAPPARNFVHGRGHERRRPHHAAALHEQVRLPHHGCYHPIRPARRPYRHGVRSNGRYLGTQPVRLRCGNVGYLGLRLVHPAHPVQRRRHGSPCRNHVRQRRHGRDQLYRLSIRHEPSAFHLACRAFLARATRSLRAGVSRRPPHHRRLCLRQPFQHRGHGQELLQEPRRELQRRALWGTHHRSTHHGCRRVYRRVHLLHRPHRSQHRRHVQG